MIYCIVVTFILFFTCLFSSINNSQKRFVDGFDVAVIVWKFIAAMMALSVAIILIVKVAAQ